MGGGGREAAAEGVTDLEIAGAPLQHHSLSCDVCRFKFKVEEIYQRSWPSVFPEKKATSEMGMLISRKQFKRR